MPSALVIVDLEGVAGVDHIDALFAGAPAYRRACELLTAETNAVIRGLRRAGFDHIRVSDSHRGGAEGPNLLTEALDPHMELCLHEDAYAAPLFAGVEVVACVGMHAAAGTRGFAAHTVSLHCDWRCGGQSLSEADIVMRLAAEAGTRVGLVSGDDVLCRTLDGLCTTVVAKQALSLRAASSLAPEDVCRELEAAASSLCPAATLIAVPPDEPLSLHFKSRWQAELAAASGRLVSPYAVEIEGAGFRERYEAAQRALGATAGPLVSALRGRPGSPELVEDVTIMLARHFGAERRALPAVAERLTPTRDAFLRLTEGTSDYSRALRALILHMLEAHAPEIFATLDLAQPLEEAVAALARVPLVFDPGVDAPTGMSRVDAWYVRAQRGVSCAPPDREAFAAYLQHLIRTGSAGHAWLLGEMATQLGLEARVNLGRRPFRSTSRLYDLYWLTHLFLLDTAYLRRPLSRGAFAAETEELLLAVPWLIARRHVDLGGEVALCLQLAGEAGCSEHQALMEGLLAVQSGDGAFRDGSMEDPADALADHATGVALLAYAGAMSQLTNTVPTRH